MSQLEDRAAQSFEALRWHLQSGATTARPVDLHDAASVVVCGDPDCAGPSGSGRWVGWLGRCPKCGGYAMSLVQIAKHRQGVRKEVGCAE